MRFVVAAALSVSLTSAPALAASRTSSLSAPAPAPAETPVESLRVAMRLETLPPGGKLAEHRPSGERYLFVVSGQLKVSNLVTGEEQLVAAGKMAAEQPGDWHVAEVVGGEPVTVYVIDRTPADAGAATTASSAGN